MNCVASNKKLKIGIFSFILLTLTSFLLLNYPSLAQSFFAVMSRNSPTVTYVSPTDANNATVSRNWGFVNATVNGRFKITDCILQWQNSNLTMKKVGTGDRVYCYLNKTSLVDGTYSYRVYAKDIVKNVGSAEVRNIRIDTTPPVLTFVPPTPINTKIFKNYTSVNVTSNEALSSAILEWDGINESMSGSGTNWFTSKAGLDVQNYTFRVFGTDLAGNSGKTDFVWVVDDSPQDHTQTLTLNSLNTSTEDTYVWEAYPNSNFGVHTEPGVVDPNALHPAGVLNDRFYVGGMLFPSPNIYARRGLLKFTIPEISNARILSAKLKLNIYGCSLSPSCNDPAQCLNLGVYKQTDTSWDESTVTWNTQPSFNLLATNSINGTEWNVKNDVSFGTTVGWTFKSSNESANEQKSFFTKEYVWPDHNISYRYPQLEIQYVGCLKTTVTQGGNPVDNARVIVSYSSTPYCDSTTDGNGVNYCCGDLLPQCPWDNYLVTVKISDVIKCSSTAEVDGNCYGTFTCPV